MSKKRSPRVEVMRMPVISTAHLTQAEAQRPPALWPSYCLEGEYGFVVYLGSMAEVEGSYDADEWPGMLSAAKWATERGFEWIRFDADAEVRDDLKSWEW